MVAVLGGVTSHCFTGLTLHVRCMIHYTIATALCVIVTGATV